MRTTGDNQDLHTTRILVRWALPAAAVLALLSVAPAHGTQVPGDHVAEFDPGAVCGSAPSAEPQPAASDPLAQLVIGAHAASLRAAR